MQTDPRRLISEFLSSAIEDYCRQKNQPPLWKAPLIKYASADDELFERLPELIPGHHLPQDFLPGAKTVISYFLPFVDEIGVGNIDGMLCSEEWAFAYNFTNTMAVWLNEGLAGYLRSLGYDAAVPTDALLDPDTLMSRWSQRHVGYIAGQGTFGLNNMLISDVGCVGRYFSIVTALPIEPDRRPEPEKNRADERCLYKREGGCMLCVSRCPAGALSIDGFDREKCAANCGENGKQRSAKVCGKCLVGLPCSSFNLPR